MAFEIKLPKPHAGQQLVLQSKARWKVLCCGRRWGKSLICQIISILTTLKKEHIAYVTPTYKLGKVFFADIINLLPANSFKANKSDLTITLKTGGLICFFSGESEQTLASFKGRKFHKVIVDEAAHIPDLEAAWNNSIRQTLTDYKGEAIFISTPRGKNFFYTLFLKGLNREDGYESFHYDTYSNPFIDDDEINEAKKTLPESVFQQEYLAIAVNYHRNAPTSSH